ncbi:MAG TPA: PspA/IM30 family protein [Ktedonobacterales bacterium]|nr:PspA/IM30 family protein [Ktedonobacterales bacterium]
MGVLSRFTNYIKMVMSSFLDRAEDPALALDYSYEKQLEQLQALRRSIADVVTNEKRLELQQAQLTQQIDKLDGQARQAITMGREDLARLALERKQGLQVQIGQFGTQIEQLKAQQAKFVEMEQRLNARVESFRTQKEMVKAQYGAAQAQVKIQEAATGISEEMSDVNLAVQRAQDKVLQMQARASALDELTASGTLAEIGPGATDQLDRELQQLSSQTDVDRQLAEMKAQMQLPAGQDSQQGQAQIPPPPISTND